MVVKKEIVTYLVAFVLLGASFSFLYFFGTNMTGFAVYEQGSQSDFDDGTYNNTEYDGSAVVLSSGQSSGIYTSKIFDGSYESSWNNISWIQKDCYGCYSDMTFYSNYNNEINGTWGEGVLTGTPHNNPIISDNKLNLVGGAIIYVDYDANLNADSQQVGAVRFKITPNYTGIGNKHAMFSISKEHNSVINMISLVQWHNGQLKIYIFDSLGSEITSQLLPVWSPTTGQEYEFELNWDLDNGETRLFIDGNQLGNTIATTGTRSSDIGLLRVGATWHAINFPPDCEIDDFIVFDKVQHISDYNVSSVLTSCLNLTVRTCDDSNCSGESFIDVDDDSPQNLSLDNNWYFQYKFNFETENLGHSPALYNVSIDYTLLNFAPSINLIFPQEGATYGYNKSINLNYSISDNEGNLDSCWYSLDGGINVSLLNCTNATFDTFEGFHNLFIYVNDSQGLESNDNVSFNIDPTGISLSILEPTGTKSSRTSIPITFTAIGNNLTCWYNVKTSIGGGVIENTTLPNCSNSFFDVSADGNYVFNLYANNTLGSSDSKNSSFLVDTSPSPSGGGGGSSGGSGGGSAPQTAKLTISKPFDVIGDAGEGKMISLEIKNDGLKFLNKCKLITNKESSSWISSTVVEDIGPGQTKDFIFNLNIPEFIDSGEYLIPLIVQCEEINKTANLSITILEKKINFEIIKFEREGKDKLKTRYYLEELSGVEQNVELQFLLFDEDNEKVAEMAETKTISPNSKEEFETIIPIDIYLIGNLNLLVNLNSEIYSTTINDELILGHSTTGLAIFGESGNGENLIIFFMLLGCGAFAFFMIRRIWRLKKKVKEKKKGVIKLKEKK